MEADEVEGEAHTLIIFVKSDPPILHSSKIPSASQHCHYHD